MTAAAVRSTVVGAHTAAGLVITTVGIAFIVMLVVVVTIAHPPAAAIV